MEGAVKGPQVWTRISARSRGSVCISFMHDLHSKTCSVENICPGVKDVSLVVLDRLVEVESVEVKRHGADAEGSKPDSRLATLQEEEGAASENC